MDSKCQNFTLVTSIRGTEGGADYNASAVFERLELSWTTLVFKAEFDKVLPTDKNVTYLRNGTFTYFTTVVAY